MKDLYVLYLEAYLLTVQQAPIRSVTFANTREMQAVALGIEDALVLKARCAGTDNFKLDDLDGADDDPTAGQGYRPRWRVLELIEEHEAKEPPPPEDEDE